MSKSRVALRVKCSSGKHVLARVQANPHSDGYVVVFDEVVVTGYGRRHRKDRVTRRLAGPKDDPEVWDALATCPCHTPHLLYSSAMERAIAEGKRVIVADQYDPGVS